MCRDSDAERTPQNPVVLGFRVKVLGFKALTEYGPLDLFEGVLGTLKSLYRLFSRYKDPPHTRGPWFQPLT